MTIDTTQLPPDGRPSPALFEALKRDLAKVRPDVTDEDRMHLAGALLASGACFLAGDMSIGVRPTHLEKVRAISPEFIGETRAPDKAPAPPTYTTPATSDAERVRRAREREAHELARRAAPRPAAKRIDMKAIDAKIAEACAADQSLARSPGRRAMLREELLRAAGVGPFSDEVA